MADNLSLSIHLNAAQANRMLEQLRRQLGLSDKAMRNVKRASSGMGSGVKKMGRDVKRAGREIAIFRKKTARLRSVMKGVSGVFRKGFRNMVGSVRSIIRPLVMVSSILGGLTVGKVFRDFVKFDQMLGILNATIHATPKQLNEVRSAIVGISAETGKSAEDLTDAMTQLASSPLFAIRKETFAQDMERNTEVLRMTAQAARGTDTSVRDMNDAFILGAKALGEDISTVEGIRRVFDLFSLTLDNGIGVMSQYTGQFGRFANEAKAAGATSEEAMAVFDVLTGEYLVPEAGTRALAMFREINQAAKDSKRISKELGVDRGIIDALYFDPATRTQRNFKDIVTNIKEFVKAAPDEQTQKQIMAALFPETRATGGWRSVLKNYEEIEGILKRMDEAELGTGKATQAKFDETVKSFGDRFQLYTNQLELLGMDVSSGVARAITQVVTGEEIDFSDLTKNFNKIRNSMAMTFSGAEGIVGVMENFIKYLRDPEGQKFLENVGTAFQNLGKLVKALFNGFVWLFNTDFMQTIIEWTANSPAIAISAYFIGLPLIKAGLIGLGGLLAKSFAKLIVTTWGGSAVAAALGAAGIIIGTAAAGLIGGAVLASIIEDIPKKQAERFQKAPIGNKMDILLDPLRGRGMWEGLGEGLNRLGLIAHDLYEGKTTGISTLQNVEYARRLKEFRVDPLFPKGVTFTEDFGKIINDIASRQETKEAAPFLAGGESLQNFFTKALEESGIESIFKGRTDEDLDFLRNLVGGNEGVQDAIQRRAEESEAILNTTDNIIQLQKGIAITKSSFLGLAEKVNNIQFPVGGGGTGPAGNSATTVEF